MPQKKCQETHKNEQQTHSTQYVSYFQAPEHSSDHNSEKKIETTNYLNPRRFRRSKGSSSSSSGSSDSDESSEESKSKISKGSKHGLGFPETLNFNINIRIVDDSSKSKKRNMKHESDEEEEEATTPEHSRSSRKKTTSKPRDSSEETTVRSYRITLRPKQRADDSYKS